MYKAGVWYLYERYRGNDKKTKRGGVEQLEEIEEEEKIRKIILADIFLWDNK